MLADGDGPAVHPNSFGPDTIKRLGLRVGLLYPLHWLVWSDPHRRARKLLRFAETEADGGRDLARAAELTKDAVLRRLYLKHAGDEQRHAEMFRTRGNALLASLPHVDGTIEANWLAPGERGLDDLKVEQESDDSLLAFLHVSERSALRRFATYESVLASDEKTRRVFAEILRDEAFHMNYTHVQLKRVCPKKYGRQLFFARASRLWKGYLRLAMALAGIIGGFVLLLQYFFVLPLFALVVKRAQRREHLGWVEPRRRRAHFTSQYG
jgi:rubrerythrin